MIFTNPTKLVQPGGLYQIVDKGDINLDEYYCITMISNPVMYESRYKLYRKFEEMVKSAGVKLITAELAFGNRPFMVTDRNNPMHLQYRSVDELWHKEMVINGAINYLMQLDPEAKGVFWVDADVFPVASPRDWFMQTAQALQHYEFVQMWENAQDMDPNYNPIGKAQTSFMAAYVKSGYQRPTSQGFWDLGGYTRHGHPGYAWGANIDALHKVGNLIDCSILGSGDRNMATALIGCVETSFPATVSQGYQKTLIEWQTKATRYIKRDVGYVPGSIYHYWHGRKANRGYTNRWKILVDRQYDPHTDIKRDAQGIYVLETHDDRQIQLRDLIRSYFRARNEDCIYTGK